MIIHSRRKLPSAGTRLRRDPAKILTVAVAWLFLMQITAATSGAYVLGSAVGDMRQAASQSGGTSCPQLTRFNVSLPGAINQQWSTSLGTGPVTILTTDQTSAGQLNEIEAVIQQSLAAWTGVSGTSLTPSSLGTLARTNSPGPGDTNTKFATPAALPTNPNAYDLESILTHELGHSFGFDHSAVWRAMMFPCAPPPGQFTGTRPTSQSPDASLSDDDRTGLRILYPDPSDTLHAGTIRGRVLPANPLVLPMSPPGVTGIFPAQVVAVDNATGAVAAAVMAGWSCSDPGPPQFDGSFAIERLTVGTSQNYQVYAEPLDGPVTLGNVIYNLTALCRNSLSDPGWPAQFACTVPASTPPFSARVRPEP